MFKLRFKSQTKKRRFKPRRKSGGKREDTPIEKRPSRAADTVRQSGMPVKKKSIVKKPQEKVSVAKVTPTEVAKSMKMKNGGKK